MALREINLVPVDILGRRHLLRHLSFWGMTLGFVLLSIFGFHLYQRHLVLTAGRVPGRLESITSTIALKSEKIRVLQTEVERLKKKREALHQIAGNFPYTVILATLADTLNDSTWLTQLSLERDQTLRGAANLRIQGSALCNEELGNFLNHLSEAGTFQNVALKYARETIMATSVKNTGAPVEVTRFQVECRVSMSD
jgi:Tfp pilus assembly protein PilN